MAICVKIQPAFFIWVFVVDFTKNSSVGFRSVFLVDKRLNFGLDTFLCITQTNCYMLTLECSNVYNYG